MGLRTGLATSPPAQNLLFLKDINMGLPPRSWHADDFLAGFNIQTEESQFNEKDESFQLRVMELNLELEEESSINALVVSRLTWMFCALLTCVGIRMSLTLYGQETPDQWWDKPMAKAAEAMIFLGKRVRTMGEALVLNLGKNLTALSAEVSKAAGDMTRGR